MVGLNGVACINLGYKMHCFDEEGCAFSLAGMWSFKEFGFRFCYYMDFYAEARRRFTDELSEEAIE